MYVVTINIKFVHSNKLGRLYRRCLTFHAVVYIDINLIYFNADDIHVKFTNPNEQYQSCLV